MLNHAALRPDFDAGAISRSLAPLHNGARVVVGLDNAAHPWEATGAISMSTTVTLEAFGAQSANCPPPQKVIVAVRHEGVTHVEIELDESE